MTSDLDILWDRIKDRCRITPSCWLWIGSLTQGGYGTITFHGEHTYIHRLVYRLMVGPIPDAHDLDHVRERCDNRNCFNPAHLEPVTRKENLLRVPGSLGSRTHCSKGHEYNAVNTYITSEGARKCRPCHAQYERDRRAAR